MNSRAAAWPAGTPVPAGWPLAVVCDLAEYAELRRRKELQRHKRIRPVSAKRQAENRQRRALVAEVTGGERPLCAVWLAIQPEWCGRWADDVHEALSRARGGSIINPDIWRFLCRACHDVLTFRPESELQWAIDLDLIRHSWDADGEAAG